MSRPVRISLPTEYPVSLDEAKAHLRVEAEYTDEDALIMALVEAATDHLDGYSGVLGRCIVTQQWRQDFASWSPLRLPFPNVSDVSVTYLDADGASQTASDHRLIDAACGPEVYFRPGWVSPTLEAGHQSPVSITFTAGYGSASVVPASIKAAILLHVGSLYENREDFVVDATVAPTGAYDALISPHRWRR